MPEIRAFAGPRANFLSLQNSKKPKSTLVLFYGHLQPQEIVAFTLSSWTTQQPSKTSSSYLLLLSLLTVRVEWIIILVRNCHRQQQDDKKRRHYDRFWKQWEWKLLLRNSIFDLTISPSTSVGIRGRLLLLLGVFPALLFIMFWATIHDATLTLSSW